MVIDELLNLAHTKDSVKKIDRYLQTAKKGSLDYHKATALKAIILSENDKLNEALTILLSAEPNFWNMEAEAICIYCSALKDIFISINQYDKALKYIDIKKKKLSLMNKDEYYKDMIQLSNSSGNKIEEKRFLNLYLEDNISKEARIFAYERLIKYHFEDKDVVSFYECYNKLKSYYTETHNNAKLSQIDFEKASMLMYEKRFLDAYDFIYPLAKDSTDAEYKVKYATMLIKIHLINNELRKASILDAEYEELTSSVSTTTAKEYYEATYELYNRMQNKFSIELILQKLNALNEALKSENIVEDTKEIKAHNPKKLKAVLEPIVIEKVINNNTQNEIENENRFSVVSDDEINITKLYSDLYQAIDLIYKADDEKLRENIRLSLIESQKLFNFKECIILLNSIDSYKGFHYKMERLYDKTYKITGFENHSAPYISYSKDIEIISDMTDDYNLSIINGEKLSYKYVIAYPLYANGSVYGSITYYLDEKNSEISYELFKILSIALASRLSEIFYNDKYSNENAYLTKLLNEIPFGIKYTINNEVSINDVAKKLYNIETNYLSQDEMYSIIVEGKNDYKSMISEFYDNKIKSKTIIYKTFNDKYIKEYFYLYELKDNLITVSMLVDITGEKKEEQRLLNIASNDDFTKLKSLNDLKDRLVELNRTKHFSFMLFNAKNFKVYSDIYGLKFAKDLIKAIGMKLYDLAIEYDGYSYHYDSDKFIFIIKNNDERKAKRLFKEILDKLTVRLNTLNSRINLNFNGAILRINQNSSELTLDKFIDLLSNSIPSSTFDGNNVAYYDSEESKKKFFDYQVELNISEAIDNAKMKVIYTELVNIKEENILGYEAHLSLPNLKIDDKYLYDVVEKRNLYEKTDKYLIMHVIMELKSFYKEHGGYFKAVIPVFDKTLNMDGFLAFLTQNLNYFKIPAKFISLKIKGSNANKEILSKLVEANILVGCESLDIVLSNKLGIFYANSKDYDIMTLKSIKDLLDMYNTMMLINDCDDKEKLDLLIENDFKYLKGNLFKDVKGIDDIINSLK